MRVLVTTRQEEPFWTFASELARGLEREGVQVAVALLAGPLAERQRQQLRALRNVEVHESTFMPVGSGSDAQEIERAGEWLLRLSRDLDVDIVHLSESSFLAVPWRAPVVLTVLRASSATEPLRMLAPSPASAPCVVAAPTRTLLDRFQAEYGTAAPSFVVPFGRTQTATLEHGKQPMVVAESEHSHDVEAVAAAARMAARISWPVFVIGAPPRMNAGTSLANTHLLGKLTDEDRASVLARASIFMQARADAQPGYGVLDAAAFKCALVLPDTEQLREDWDGAAAFVAPDDEEALRAALIWLIDDSEARNDLGGRAQHRAQSFTAERMASAYLSIYIEVAVSAATVRMAVPT